MTSSENQETSAADIESVLAEFDSQEQVLGAFCAKTKDLIEACLQDANIRYHSVQSRVKTRKKLKEKYLDSSKKYRRLADITDLAGLRVITYYEDDIDRVAEVVRKEFDLDRANSIDKRDTEPDRFAYSALNCVCRHLSRRAADVEYRRFGGVQCEIQIVSILRHAWSEIEHEWYDLKTEYPRNIKRRFYRLAALLELAESEFLDLRNSRTQYERSVAVRVEAKVPDLLVDAVSMRSFIEQEPLVSELDAAIASVLGGRVIGVFSDGIVERRAKTAILAGMTKVREVRESLERYKTEVPELVRRCIRDGIWPRPPGREIAVTRGICIYHLAALLVSARGAEAFTDFLKALD
jgi:putative GTP pyrophosphokinase